MEVLASGGRDISHGVDPMEDMVAEVGMWFSLGRIQSATCRTWLELKL